MFISFTVTQKTSHWQWYSNSDISRSRLWGLFSSLYSVTIPAHIHCCSSWRPMFFWHQIPVCVSWCACLIIATIPLWTYRIPSSFRKYSRSCMQTLRLYSSDQKGPDISACNNEMVAIFCLTTTHLNDIPKVLWWQYLDIFSYRELSSQT